MLSILISSTFNDMQAERDVIRARVAPALRRIAARYGQSVRLIDLRWGVNTADMSEEDAARKVLETCLNEIDRCDGYMICLLGNRYGWVPDYSKLTTVQEHGIDMPHPVSVTELEIQYGILQRNTGEKSVIFLRDAVTGLPDQLQSRYNDPPEDGRMSALKARLEALPDALCRHYFLEYGPDGEFRGINSFAEQLIEAASGLLHKVFGAACQPEAAEMRKRKFDNIIEEHCETYLPHPLLEQELSHFASKPLTVLMLQGQEGSGRTAFISRLAKNPPAGVRVIPYFCASGYDQCTSRDILAYFIGQLDPEGDDATLSGLPSQQELAEYFSELIAHQNQPLWFAIDGLELLDADDDSRLSWLPQDPPENIRFVFTSIKQDSACNQLGESFFVQYCKMPPMPDTAGFIRTGLAAAGKAVPDEILSKVAEHPLSSNYLFCDMVVRMLMLMDRHDFAVMNRDGGGIDAINAYILAKINNLPETMEEMAFLFLYDCGEQITPGNTAHFLSAIAQAPMGLRAQDLQALLPDDWDEAEFSYFTAFLDGFLVCDDRGCYTLPSPVMHHACAQVGDFALTTRIARYFTTLPDNDPIKAGSAMPIFLIYELYDQAAELLLANPRLKVLYQQLWNVLIYARSSVSTLLNRDDVLELVITHGLELCDDLSRLSILSDILKSRTPPKDGALHRRMLRALAQLQLRCNDKKGAYQTLSKLLPLEDTSLSWAETAVLMTDCSFVEEDAQIATITQLLDQALDAFRAEDALSPYSNLLLCKGLFYRYLFALRDAIGVSVHRIWSYEDYINSKQSAKSSISYVDSLILLRLASLPGSQVGASVFRVLIGMCELGEVLLSHLSTDHEFNAEYRQLFLTLLKVMGNVDSPAEPFKGELGDDAADALREFRVLRNSLVTMAHAVALTSLRGRYSPPMLKLLAHLQIHLAHISDDAPKQKMYLEQSTRILFRYFSTEPLPDFAETLASAYLNLADCYLQDGERTLYEDALENWGSVALSISRQAIKVAREQCLRYPDEIHERALIQARHKLNVHWTEYSERLWLTDLYEFKSNIDLMLTMYRTNNLHNINMSLPTSVINIRAALVLVKKLMELEAQFDNGELSDLYRRTLPVAFHSLLTTALEVVLLSEQNIGEDSDDVMSTPQFYYPKTAAFVEDYMRRCKERDLDISSETILRLSFRLAQLKLKSAECCDEDRDETLSEVILLLDTLISRLTQPIRSDWLLDEISVDSIRRLQCRAYLMLGDSRAAEDEDAAAVFYRQTAELCVALYVSATATAAQKNMAVQYLRYALPPLLAYYDRHGMEDACSSLRAMLAPLLGALQ